MEPGARWPTRPPALLLQGIVKLLPQAKAIN
jgi:hypothetical protein